ncbi:LIM and senescent cell antigen-like-containing domain protein 1-like [Homarus americanus]|uniref:LIM and senescent cell antigen-like-containing domain protein 1-like n=1 Tax=Homarus americanus TaxID=6706 RepID=A0A8J5JFD7_HOMAM|nr:LIM and senescent cell antigen-like-containing domain protein 1-like [Homarus americanus]
MSLKNKNYKKNKLALEIEASHLYNRRKNGTPQSEDSDLLKPEDGTSQHLQSTELPLGCGASRNSLHSQKSPIYVLPYASTSSFNQKPTGESQLKQVNPVMKPPRKYYQEPADNDPSEDFMHKRVTALDTPELEAEFRKQFIGRIDLEEALKDRPPSFTPPERRGHLSDGGPVQPHIAEAGPEIGQFKFGMQYYCSDGCLHIMSLGSMTCTRCGDGFEPQEKIVNSNGQLWHTQCFVVIKAMNSNWHPRCFTCELCSKELADLGFIRNAGRALCHECNARVKAESLGKYMCHKCHSTIDGQPLRWRGDTFHPYHYNCASCGNELTADAREVKSRPGYTANEMNELYCLRCHDKMGIPICGACRRPIEERVVTALGKHWHVEHFVCAKCEKPFMGNRHYERKGMAYCETHYHELFGSLCFICNAVIYGDVVMALNKAWCSHHFACAVCDIKMTQKTKFFEFDQKPICKKCYEKFPQELKKRLKKQHDTQARGGKPIP